MSPAYKPGKSLEEKAPKMQADWMSQLTQA